MPLKPFEYCYKTIYNYTYIIYFAQGEFTEGGVETHFTIGSISAIITSESSGNKKKGLLYKLLVDGKSLEPVKEQ